MTDASLKTYYNVDNQETRISHKKLIKKVFEETNDKYTIREMATIVNLPYTSTQKRISDLFKDGLIKIDGTKEENEQLNSIYVIERNPKMFSQAKRTNIELLKQAMHKKLPPALEKAVLKEFNRLKEKQK